MSSIVASEFLHFIFAAQVRLTSAEQQEIASTIETFTEIKIPLILSGIFRQSIEKLR
jgi:hypothetical protein